MGPGRTADKPNAEFTYRISGNAPTGVTAREIKPKEGLVASYQLYDGLLRPRQTQVHGTSGGRVLTDIYYDSRGLGWKANHPYFDKDGEPGTTLRTPTLRGDRR